MGSGWDVSSGTQLVHSASSEKKTPIHHVAFPQQNLNETIDHFLSKGHNMGVLKHSFAQNFINPNKQSWHSIFKHTAFFFTIKKKDLYFQVATPTWNGKAIIEGPREDQSHHPLFPSNEVSWEDDMMFFSDSVCTRPLNYHCSGFPVCLTASHLRMGRWGGGEGDKNNTQCPPQYYAANHITGGEN